MQVLTTSQDRLALSTYQPINPQTLTTTTTTTVDSNVPEVVPAMLTKALCVFFLSKNHW
jgi:hypothetical protein